MMPEQQGNLVRPLWDEVMGAIKGLNREGAPGLDKFLVFFFSELWKMIKSEVMATLDEFERGNYGIEKINNSHLFLLPKCPQHLKSETTGPSCYLIHIPYHIKGFGK